MVLEWKAHILRAQNQDQAKQDALRSLDSTTVLVIMDWAVKFTQMKYREKQSEWYDKLGLNWHVSCIISTSDTEHDLEVASYVHLFDSCAQDWYAVLSIVTHLLRTAKATQLQITKAYLRSDGAGCYHNNDLIAAVSQIGKHIGIQILRYDFSEPQFGKDVCDRIISPLKSALTRYCNEGNDILSASDMHRALGARKPEGIVVSRAYGIGPGKLIKWNVLNIKCESLIIAKDSGSEKGFSSVTPRRMTLPTVQEEEADVVDDASYQCNEPGCSYVSANFEALQDHINFGRHVLSTKANEGIYDRLRREWAHKFATLSIEPGNRTSNIPVKVSYSRQDWTPESRGWALQNPRGGGTRFSENIKSYLQSRFDTGELTGKKADPNQISKEMRAASNLDGTRKFNREVWLNKTQIQSFFSRLAARKRKRQTEGKETALGGDNADAENEEQFLEDEIKFLIEKHRNQVIEEVLDQVGLVNPITYDGYNICELAKLDKLSRFKVEKTERNV
ncbi:Hypothetical predicted protein [Paramuricea clavata]|uniref:Uncharacterized protein n=1 Tax=Paramuricea clavata TaxID=317549 RepID=A0A7D9DMS8_PARCT|nr:Hypothetical predicted protein [Paramuricea clavata]